MKSLILTTLVVGAAAAAATGAIVSLNPTGDAYVRNNGNEGSSFDTSELLVGRVAPGDWIRSVLAFDLSSIPDGSTINAVTLTVGINTQDAGTTSAGTDSLGGTGLQLRTVSPDAEFDAGDGSADFGWNASSWGGDNSSGGVDDVPWSGGGNIKGADGSTSLLSTIENGTIPIRTVTPGTQYTFASSPEFIAAITGDLGDDSAQFQMVIPALESSFNERKLIRFASSSNGSQPVPVLQIDYTPIPEPTGAALGALGLLAVLRRRR